MINLRNFTAAMEDFGYMEDGADVSIEQTIQVEVAADEETQEVVEIEEEVSTSEDVVAETEEMLATLEYLAHAETVVEEFGWSRPVATMLNKGQDSANGVVGDMESFLGVTLPANESLEMVSSPYDDATVAAMESFKQSMKDFWNWIKKQAAKVRDFFKRLWERITSFFTNNVRVAKRYGETIEKAKFDEKKFSKNKFKLMNASAFKEAEGVIVKAGTIIDSIGTAIRLTANDAANTNPKSDYTHSINKALKDAADTIRGIVGAKLVTFDEKESSLSVTADKDSYIDKFKIKESTVKGAGWTKDVAKNWQIVATADKVAQRIKVNKAFIEVNSAVQKMETRSVQLADGSEAAKSMKTAGREAIKGIKNLNKVANVVAKFLMHLNRQFIRGQRAVLSCRAS